MVIINKSSANTIALTLNEKVSIQDPVFLFEFKNDSSNESKYFISADLSSVDRYNKFTITEKTSPDPLNGEVDLTLDGLWSYFVREQSSPTNLDPTQSGAIVEKGKVKVVGTPEVNITYDPVEPPHKVYNG